MKQPKKLTRDQKEKLSKKGYDAKKYRFLLEDDVTECFVDISEGEESGELIWIEK